MRLFNPSTHRCVEQQKVAKSFDQSRTAEVAMAGCLHKGTISLKRAEVWIQNDSGMFKFIAQT